MYFECTLLNDLLYNIASFLSYFRISIKYGLASLQLSVKYPQLPDILIGVIETLI